MNSPVKQSKWFFHPILIFIFSVGAVVLSLFLYIYWYAEVSAGLKSVIQKANLDPDHVLASQTWVVIMVLSILVGSILIGIFIIFVYNQKTLQLYRLQRNFINNFTHELKTPVTSLKLYLETFRKYEFSREDQLKYIGYMLQDADRMSDNINRILNLAKVESKTYGGKFAIEDLVKVVERFYKNSRHLFVNCDINIHRPSEGAFSYLVNISLFEVLLMNLFTNAVKYNESEVPGLDIYFERNNKALRIRFEDNGIGIPKSEIKKIFKKFYQIGRSVDMSAKGTGLGLYLVESIARIHKGKVAAEPREGEKGSVFTVILPSKLSRTGMK